MQNINDLIQNEKLEKIVQNNDLLTLKFENNIELPLLNFNKEINIPSCSFCNKDSIDNTLFTINNNVFICIDCTQLALKTFIENGHNIDLKIDKFNINNKILPN